VLDAALELFGEHGVSATSLQMIADRIGVTKAAVYHQFPAKNDIVLGLLEEVFEAFAALADDVERRPDAERRDVVVDGIVGLMVGQRQVSAALYRDPEMERVVSDNAGFRRTRGRLEALIVRPGTDGEQRRRLEWAVIGAGFTRVVVDPQFAALSDDELRGTLVRLAHRILDQP
jgi:AcrR family transcriptional regulator